MTPKEKDEFISKMWEIFPRIRACGGRPREFKIMDSENYTHTIGFYIGPGELFYIHQMCEKDGQPIFVDALDYDGNTRVSKDTRKRHSRYYLFKRSFNMKEMMDKLKLIIIDLL